VYSAEDPIDFSRVVSALARRFALAALAIVLAFAVGELALRYLLFDAVFGSQQVAGADLIASDVGGVRYLLAPSVPGTSNNLGLRNPSDTAVAAPPETYRILMLGDSVLFGLGIHDLDELATSVAERRIEALTGARVEILNLSLPGLGFEQELALAKARAPQWSPDLVVFAYTFNDPEPTPLVGELSNAPSLDRLYLMRLLALWRAQDGLADQDRPYRAGTAEHAQLAALFARAAAWAEEQPVAIAPIPLLRPHSGGAAYLDVVRGLCASHRIEHLDVARALGPLRADEWGRIDERVDGYHYGATGQRALGEALAQLLAPKVVAGTPHTALTR
jgi:lysophospholipase L1-like esterase